MTERTHGWRQITKGMPFMDPLTIVRRRLHYQRLASEQFSTPEQAVGWLGAVQAQEFAEAKYSVGQRVQACTDAQVDQALDTGTILRTHLMRPTWHFVTADDIRWMLRLTAPRIHQLNRHWYRKFELDEDLLLRGDDILATALAGGLSRTRAELADTLHQAGISGDGLRMGYLLMHAELEGIICSGPRPGRQHTYALLDDRVAPTPDLTRDEALSELCLRFFESHGPATIHDFTNWSSLTVADAKIGLALIDKELGSWTDGDGTTWWSAIDPVPDNRPTGAFLIPMFDESTIAYKDLRVILAREPTQPDLLQRPIVIDGYTVGSWKRAITKRSAAIEATLFISLDRNQADALQAAVEGFGRFMDLPATLTSHPLR